MFFHPEDPALPRVTATGIDAAGWCHERVASTPQELGRVVDAVVSAMAALGYAERHLFGTRLALEEALANAMKHGHRGDPSKLIQVRYRVTPERLVAEVEDEGPGFAVDQVPDPRTPERLTEASGRGLLLMRAYMTQVCYTGRGNRVFLCLERDGP
jgi:serine/threonine-protein kinase RsbW